jgi:diguanylate cyclase (GGDEF)-like protein
LANRGRVIEVLEDLLRHAPHEVAILYLDLDGFKRVNDTLGHAGGDALLQAAAARLTSRLRDDATIGRIGGDEFLVVAPVDGKTNARSLASRLSGCFAEPYHVEQQLVRVGASIGIVVVECGTPIDHAMRRADLAMYAAKRGGGGAVDADALESAS